MSPANPGVTKLRYPVPVVIESNDMLLTLRSDHAPVLSDALAWLGGSDSLRGRPVASPALRGLVTFTSSRHMFTQIGLPRAVAHRSRLPYARFIQPRSPMWMGFTDQQVGASGPAAICTFAGNSSARHSDAVAGDYFDNGSIQHLSHDILDMLQYYDMDTAAAAPGADGTFVQRVQYVFHAPEIAPGGADQFADGGGPAFLPNANRGTGYARRTARGIGTNIDFRTGHREHRMGHLSCLQRSARAADGTPVHIRMDGPGFDSMDVPGGSTSAEAAVHDLRAVGGLLLAAARQPGLAGSGGPVRGDPEEQRAGAVHHRHPAAELPLPAPPAPGLPPRRIRLTRREGRRAGGVSSPSRRIAGGPGVVPPGRHREGGAPEACPRQRAGRGRPRAGTRRVDLTSLCAVAECET